MIGDIIGFAVLKRTLLATEYFWGSIDEIAGKTLTVLERNEYGDCLCIVPKGLVDVASPDIERFMETKSNLKEHGVGAICDLLVKAMRYENEEIKHGGRDAANAVGGLPVGPGPGASPNSGCRGREPGSPG